MHHHSSLGEPGRSILLHTTRIRTLTGDRLLCQRPLGGECKPCSLSALSRIGHNAFGRNEAVTVLMSRLI